MIWGYPKWMVYKFIMENHIKMDDLGVPPISGNLQILLKLIKIACLISKWY